MWWSATPPPDAAGRLRGMIDHAWPALLRLGAAPGADPAAWRFEPDPVLAVEGADFVQESAPERYDVKKTLLPRLDAALPPEVVIASSSSGLLISRLSQGCRHPGRCVIGHPFNPPHLVPLVEVVGGATASRASLDAAMAFYRAIGKHPIEIRNRCPAISPTGCRRRCGARPCTWWRKAWRAWPTWTPPSAKAPACAGR